jgi:hypothetical protein
MAIPGDIREIAPGCRFNEGDETTQYWIRRDTVLYRHYPLKGAHVPTFRFYLGSFAKDHKHCYCTSIRLSGGNGAAFRALNFTYATDSQFVWTMGGRIKDVDVASFDVCDDGVHVLGSGHRVPYGYGKDKNRVYYYDSDGKPNWVRKATPASFVSLNDGHFAKDDTFVFCGAATIAKAKVKHWRKIGGYYSKDDSRIFYFNREIRNADYETFEVVPNKLFQIAKDKNGYYNNDQVASDAKIFWLLEGADGAT